MRNSLLAAGLLAGLGIKPSRDLYQRCVKTLVQVGPRPDGTFARNAGMPLEITAAENPYARRAGQPVEFGIVFRGQPLTGALVRYWNRDAGGRLTQERQRSDAGGRVRFGLRSGRIWLAWCR